MGAYATDVPRVVPASGLSASTELQLFTRLRDVQLRTVLETERGIYIAEGEKVIRRALGAGHEPHSLLLTERWLDQLGDVVPDDVPCYVMTEAEIETLTGFHVHRGALAAMHRPPEQDVATVLASAQRVVVAEDLVDHTNLGALFRNAAALGFDAVLLSPRCADPWYRRAIKVAMGSVFAVPHARFQDWYAAPGIVKDAGFTTYAMTLSDDAVDLASIEAADRCALVVGSEGHGLTDYWQREADVSVTIPMHADIDSLNVAASVAIACWHLSQSAGSSMGETGQSSG
jgi:tRNA G18 (ribose-2'-O)-methylase SpoU